MRSDTTSLVPLTCGIHERSSAQFVERIWKGRSAAAARLVSVDRTTTTHHSAYKQLLTTITALSPQWTQSYMLQPTPGNTEMSCVPLIVCQLATSRPHGDATPELTD